MERVEAKMRALDVERAALWEELVKEDVFGGNGVGDKWVDGMLIDEVVEKVESVKLVVVGGASGVLLATFLIVS